MADLFLGRPRSRRYPKFNIRRDIPDPNPVDMGIQAHIYLLLSKHAPDRASRLCKAMELGLSNRNHWPYYLHAPWVFTLREADLEAAGCALRIPESIVSLGVPGQQPYLELARLIRDGRIRGVLRVQQKRAREFLRQLAADDFAASESNPLLLYHNDPTSPIPRYYWSRELALTLWLRLSAELQRLE